MIIQANIEWAMPSRWTFQIPPIAEFVARHLQGAVVVVDPFCGTSTIASHRNDLAQDGEDAEMFCRRLLAEGVKADAVLFDPPYSPRQIAECYSAAGLKAGAEQTQNSALCARVHNPLRDLLKPGGVALSFGWNSSGFGKAWPLIDLLLVRHGGAHNDTICVAQRKIGGLFDSDTDA